MMTVIPELAAPGTTATAAVVAPRTSPESTCSRLKHSATGPSPPLSSDSPSPSTAPLASAMARNRISVSACRLSPTEVLRLGDVVWCKLRGWPWWPARICNLFQSPSGSPISGGSLPSATSCSSQVVWFGTGEFSEFPTHRLLPFLPHFKTKLDSAQVKKKHKYKRAIEEALAEARGRESNEANKSEEKEKQQNGLPTQLLSDESGSEFGGPLTIDQGSTTSSSSVVVEETGSSNRSFLPQSCSIRQ